MPTTGSLLVVGLGNPGPTYAATRHNVGYMVANVLAARSGVSFKRHRTGAEIAETHLGAPPAPRAVLAKPLSFMNLSGGPVSGLASYFHIEVAGVVVIHDELDLPLGTVRLKQGGGDNGHNGLRSITKSLSTKDYVRIRVGIGRPPGRQDPADFVLKPFASAERAEVGVIIEEAADAVELFAREGLAVAQNRIHTS
ncbi:peptidyl-tRNA hydrolase [Antricoccus suffuscus]|uniref:Peptidyl-tRNA hydrolase n=1 Tax=Antricoccus suffuscus TaxID=1629062 RepID=A0A2T1A012_9ACTN|nr:aminoacyl-tRNA hydrolase [Antricoccus suffuscus]PRZ41943.1 peptidyl-tRNA hydrolase [Antricoccus suffuscus]